jgi:predicted Zn-dependent protease
MSCPCFLYNPNMSSQQTSSTTWAIISASCLVLGLAVGYVVFGHRPGPPVVTPVADGAGGAPTPSTGAPPVVDEQHVRALRDILAKDPRNAQAAVQLGNHLYDAGRYAEAVGPYQQAFALDSGNVNVSTDLGTALWYSGKPDEALQQYERSLAIQADHAQTLFNQGIVRLEGKGDAAKAIQSWEKLLAAHPNYPERAKVEQLLEQTRQKVGSTPVAPVRSTR